MKNVILLCMAFFISFSFAQAKFSCVDANKKYCKHMRSCEEAKFYLKQCGKKRLDRDRDGIPCESICGNG